MWFPGKPMDGAAYGVAFKTGGGKTQTTMSKSEPWKAQQPFLEFGFNQARDIYDSGSPQYFPGQTLAGIDPAQTAALNATEQRAMQGNPLVPAAQGQVFDTLGGAYLGSNPFRDAMVDRIRADVLPGVDSSFSMAGRTGSGLHGRAIGEGLGSAIGALDYGAYENERNRMLQAAAGAPALAQADYADLAQLGQVGDARRALEQGQINDDIARFNYEQNLPNQRLANYMQMVQGNYGGTNTTTQPTQGGSLGAGLLGAGLLGASLIPSGGLSALGGLGKGGASAIGGGGMGALSYMVPSGAGGFVPMI